MGVLATSGSVEEVVIVPVAVTAETSGDALAGSDNESVGTDVGGARATDAERADMMSSGGERGDDNIQGDAGRTTANLDADVSTAGRLVCVADITGSSSNACEGIESSELHKYGER